MTSISLELVKLNDHPIKNKNLDRFRCNDHSIQNSVANIFCAEMTPISLELFKLNDHSA